MPPSAAQPPAPAQPLEAEIAALLRSAGCVFAEDEARLLIDAASTRAQLDALAARRVAGEPLEQILGWAQFAGLRISLAPGVFVPRLRTEFLVEQALVLLADDGGAHRSAGVAPTRPVVVLDLCCGSGALGAAVATALAATGQRSELYAVDIHPAAVACARANLVAVDGQVFQGDLYDALPAHLRGRVDVLLANAPYVPTGEIRFMPPEARLHEPLVTLDGGADGLDIQRRVAAGALQWLAPGGHLLVETSARQAPETMALLAGAGLLARVATCSGKDATVVVGAAP
ncbi:putative protein N(5)-glutamine methyltransferase [Arthrobacter sp. 35W]|uniref:putative protein N(5)-glutamine methyltransferase n=1 Tax=Arthrobacter sp. 35W TaxID=1132441 RepID=UPI0018CB96BF|nr:putative protein N(5)-glutamine methyltransferase [Arthrobacter sp. 35W]